MFFSLKKSKNILKGGKMAEMFLRLIALTLCVLFIGFIVPGITVNGFFGAFLAACLIAFINTFIKPVLLFLTLPVNILTLGISILFINALLFMFVAKIVPQIQIENFISAFIGALLLSVLSVGISIL